MAEQSDIEDVKDLLDKEADWDDEKISAKLDSGKTVYQVVQNYWEAKAVQYHTAISISESGSSRDLSRLFDNASKLAEYWRGRAEAEEAANEEDEDEHIRFNTITRI
ncbi:hypothetical protein SEA_LITTLEFELLA_15 [Gordonia phage LittleFella]|nr:hypothetical protein SEA_LITTLEFELLA_15 [Gordonia phage LittleFella]